MGWVNTVNVNTVNVNTAVSREWGAHSDSVHWGTREVTLVINDPRVSLKPVIITKLMINVL